MTSSGSRRRNLLLIVAAVLALVLAVAIGVRVAGVLFALVAPPGPPLPPDSILITQQNRGHGSDTWVYHVEGAPCDVVAFFEASGGDCAVRPGWCEGDTANGVGPARPMATCEGRDSFSAFGLRWEAEIRSQTGNLNAAEITISREVLWSASQP